MPLMLSAWQLLLFATSPKLVLAGVRCGAGGRCAACLVLVLGIMDGAVDRGPGAFHLACGGGLPTAGAMAIVLGAGGCTRAGVTPTRGVEEVGDEEELEMVGESSGNRGRAACARVSGVNPLRRGYEAACPSAAAAEAGRLRCRASAALQFKVFDPGRWRGR